MTPSVLPTSASIPDDSDLRRMSATLRRSAPLLLLSALLAGAAAYALSSRQTPVYQASSSIVAIRNDGGSSLLTGSTFAAPSLPPSALQTALQSPELRPLLLTTLKQANLSASTLSLLTQTVQNLSEGANSDLSVQALGQNQQDSGAFEIQAKAATPQAAQALADAGAATLLNWDASRAKQRLLQLRTSFENQFSALDRQLQASVPAGTTARRADLERQTLLAAQGQVLRNLGQIAALEQTTTGSLSPLASAELPQKAVSPSPVRSAVLAAVLALLLLGGLLLLLAARRRVLYDEQDVQRYGVPLLGHLGNAGQAGPQAEAGNWREGINFLRVNLLSQLPVARGRQVVVASAGRSEGRSSVTAALAQSLSRSGERVLIVDADTQNAAQSRLWSVTSVASSLSAVQPAVPLNLSERLDLLPAAAITGEVGQLDQARLLALLDTLKGDYDTVLLDAPPLLTSADALSVCARANGLVLIAVPGVTTLPQINAVFEAVQTIRAQVLGLVLNDRPSLSKLVALALPAPSQELSRATTR